MEILKVFQKNPKVVTGFLLCFIFLGALLFINNTVDKKDKEDTALVLENELNEFKGLQQEQDAKEELGEDLQPVEPEQVYVDVKGSVQKPDVYSIESNKRIYDAIELAGGFTAEADQARINLAARVKDEMVIYVPAIGEEHDPFFQQLETANEHHDGKININSATSDQLQQLPGIGPAKATSIINYREEHGPFKNSNDLLNISGIGEKSLEKILDLITVYFVFYII
ncbi:helix-hairpin-helix domain-containing protein [Bacillus sp. Marseille-P3661]|uniref:helix-hairpin-helix domain-containing protein n=1 Tax=Bacillus sp. Marseille-P3661 TaxID=1936234 RepID=UPI000C8351C8|nr:helix-hairpin-helix domain-containing protein [Bacillus sp. Marseille-P3661]